MNTIECRSPAQIHDDDLVDAHDLCVDALNDFVIGLGYLYTGQRRTRIQAARDLIAQHIEEGTQWPRPYSAYYYVHFVIHR